MASRGLGQIGAGSAAVSHESFLRHKSYRWLKIATLLCLVSLVAYIFADVQPRPNGGSWLGYTLGTIGALLILWLTLLGVRKRAMTPGRWSLKAWTSAHVYLGLSLIIVATLHTGFQFGWNVHTLAYALMMLVIISGIYGISVYALLPGELSDNRVEMTKPQMIEAVRKVDQQLQISAQPLAIEDSELVLASVDTDPFKAGLFRRLSGHYPNCGNRRALREMRRRLTTATGEEADNLETIVGLLERKELALSRIRRHLRIRAMLEVWLYVHVPVTFALIAALLAHIISVFFYW
ncbi:hypothetical protein [Allosphingosinicella indica]|uniref:Ferric reductase like transmembrane component n=1 Tax=Allosphingosinicella indica TaxID=941907 RepID=A0A1X7GL96_9SPHN|nr:hypothetical protein [Allosphingosinicella indica]SMF70748.1 hypothetical protein SAMN06295910_1941 [Allosphingosinicella indica]